MDSKETQRLSALHQANMIRIGIAEVCYDLRGGHITVKQALQDERIEPCSVYRFLRAIPGFGEKRSSTAMRRLGIVSIEKRIRDLTLRQILLLNNIEKDVPSAR